MTPKLLGSDPTEKTLLGNEYSKVTGTMAVRDNHLMDNLTNKSSSLLAVIFIFEVIVILCVIFIFDVVF